MSDRLEEIEKLMHASIKLPPTPEEVAWMIEELKATKKACEKAEADKSKLIEALANLLAYIPVRYGTLAQQKARRLLTEIKRKEKAECK